MSILIQINDAITRNAADISKWLDQHKQKAKPPIYASVDIRNSGYKISAIDTNLYPAGFNNIYPRDLQVAADLVKKYITDRWGKTQKILILPEEHSRNQPYLQNLLCLQKMFRHADFEIEVGMVSKEMRKDSVELEVGLDHPLKIHRAYRENDRLRTSSLEPDLVVVNNDFSQEPPAELLNLKQNMDPPLEAGWYSRKKSRHFEILHQLIDEFCKLIDVDPWLLQVETELVGDVDVNRSEDRERLADVVDKMLVRTSEAFKERGIDEEPYIFLKDNAGTYGIAVTTVKKPEDILQMNSKTRKKMTSGKGRHRVSEILVQEGVPTKILVGDCPAEPVIYLGGNEVIGGFFRKHCDQDEMGSLNVKGMLFSLMTFSSPLENGSCEQAQRDDLSLTVYGTLGKIAYLALGYEIQELLP